MAALGTGARYGLSEDAARARLHCRRGAAQRDHGLGAAVAAPTRRSRRAALELSAEVLRELVVDEFGMQTLLNHGVLDRSANWIALRRRGEVAEVERR